MQRFIFTTLFIFLLAAPYSGQSNKAKPSDEEISMEKFGLLSELQTLESKSVKIDKPIARARANAEIADAAWTLDREWAKKLLREAYDLTLPEESQGNLRSQPAGAPPTLPTKDEIARNSVRNRVLDVARRDKDFAAELLEKGSERLGKQKANYMNASLASRSIAEGDVKAASNYIMRAIEAEPTVINAGLVILDVAIRDRAAADNLILQYIERLRTTPLSQANGSASRIYFLLKNLVFPNDQIVSMKDILLSGSNTGALTKQIQPSGRAVVETYIRFMLDSLGRLEQNEPGSVRALRADLLSLWLPIKQYAPELTGAFLELERLSRRAGDDASLPQISDSEARKDKYEKRIKDASNKDQPDDLTINIAANRGDFDNARKLIEKLPDGARKAQLMEIVNKQEAISLANRGDLLEAERLAERLSRATSILQVYPIIISKCVAGKNQSCATALVYQAMKQLKRADVEPMVVSQEVPTPVDSRKNEVVLLSLSRLAKAVAPINETLALEVLDETVTSANASDLSTEQGQLGLDIDTFKKLASKNETRVRQAANKLTDPLRQITALAAIYQWKAEGLAKTPRNSN